MGECSLDALVNQYVAGRREGGELAAGTAKGHRYALLSFAGSFGNRPVQKLGERHVRRWMAQPDASGRPYADRSLRLRLTILRGFCRWLVRTNRVKRDPCIGVASIRVKRSVPKVFEAEEVGMVLDTHDARLVLVVLLMVQCTLRCCEVSRLDLADIGRKSILVSGKGGHERNEPLVEEVRLALADYLSAERGYRPGPLIVSRVRPGARLTPKSVSQLVGRRVREVGVKDHPYDGKGGHAFRRTCATDLLDRGVPIEQVAEALGHVGLENVLAYAKTRTHRLEAAMGGRWYGAAQVVPIEATG